MKISSNFKRSQLVSAVSMAVAVTGMAAVAPVYAQEEATTLEEVVVTGYRRSLMTLSKTSGSTAQLLNRSRQKTSASSLIQVLPSL